MAVEVCGPFSQTLFLGASIISFSSSLGWNGDQGRLTVELVEDTCRGSKVYYDGTGTARITTQPDFFNPPKVGSPVYFRFGSFSYGGILQGWEQQTDTKGGRTFSIQLVDGIEILEGCQVIINNYTGGTLGVPNLINAFGYMESLLSSCDTSAHTSLLNPPLDYIPAQGFGGANVAEDGMSWFQIREAINALTVVPSGFGGQLQLRDNRFYIDISELPYLDANFRFTGDSINLMEAISQVCSASGMDFFTELLYFAPPNVSPGFGGIAGLIHPDVLKFIKIRTVLRNVQRTSAYNVDLTVGSPIDLRLNLGKITQFVGTGSGRTRSSRGLELRSDITNSFLVGDNRQDLWQQSYSGSNNTYTDTIWPFWGTDINGFPIISNDINDDHNFTIATTSFGPDLIGLLGNTYNMKMIELRAALTGMEEWLMYLWSEKRTIAEDLDTDAAFTDDLVSAISSSSKPPRPDDLKRTGVDAVKRAFKHAGGDPDFELVDKAELQKRLYDIVRSYAELAGKKFLVSLPLICSAVDPNVPFVIKTNWDVSDGGWTDSNVQISPLATALTPNSPILELLRLEDGRIQCFVYFNTTTPSKLIDYSLMPPDDVIPISPTECYVRASFDEIVFLNPTARTYPRAVVSINSPVVIKANKDAEADAKIIDALIGWLTEAPRSWLDMKASRFGDDTNKLPLFPMPSIPQGAAVPLRSTNLSYGPWITTLNFGPAAKTLYERDTSLSPWSFGSTNIMNYAGQIKVESQVTQQIVSEAGSFTIPGAPPGRLGDVLIAGGPEITKIDVEVGLNGVTSSVQLRTWIPNFGELGRRRIQALRTAGTFQNRLQRAFLNRKASFATQTAFNSLTRPLLKSDRFDRHSSHTVIAGEIIDDFRNVNYKRTNVVLTDLRKALPEVYEDYGKKALMELGGLFRPFETSGIVGHGLPAFSGVVPSVANPVTALSLNPFKTAERYNGNSIGHDVEYITRGASITGITDLSIAKASGYSEEPYRGIGLRAPVVLVGWGFDSSNKPVPNATPGSPGNSFATDYLKKPELWKAGPLDVRWDESRGVWSAAGGSSFRLGKLVEPLIPGRAAFGQLGTVTVASGNPSANPYAGNFGVTVTFESGLTKFFDGLKNSTVHNYPTFPVTPSGAIVYIQKELTSNEWFVTGASVW